MNGTEFLYEITEFLKSVCGPLTDASEYMVVPTHGYAGLFSKDVVDEFIQIQSDINADIPPEERPPSFLNIEIIDIDELDFPSEQLPKWFGLVKISEQSQNTYRFESAIYRYTITSGDEDYVAYGAMGYHYNKYQDRVDILSVCYIPKNAYRTWIKLCNSLAIFLGNRNYFNKYIQVIGGRNRHIDDLPDIDEVILPIELREEIINDVFTFFDQTHIYLDLNLRPFRKFLFAGAPGTGKTMLCGAISKMALSQDKHVIYISADDREGPSFGKISEALYLAHDTDEPTIIILEELDAYVRDPHYKALVLNMLDGMDAEISDKGVLLIATTNYPGDIDERIFKRPGRIDRIYVFEVIDNLDTAQRTLRRYLMKHWDDSLNTYANQFVGESPAFVREVVIQTLLRLAYNNLNGAVGPLQEHLELSYQTMKQQSKLDEISLKKKRHVGFDVEDKFAPIRALSIGEEPSRQNPNEVR